VIETLVDLLEHSVGEHGDRTALSARVGLRDDVWSYRRLATAADALAAHLVDELGVEPGARVALLGPSSPRLAAAIFGVLRAGLVLVPLDPTAMPDTIGRVLERTGAEVLIDATGRAPELPHTLDLSTLPFDSGRRCAAPRPEPVAVAEIVFTSGTTGRPKGVVLTHANVVANVRSARAALQPTRDYRLLSVLPLSHMFEQTAGLFLPLHVGASVHYPASRQSPVVIKALRRHRITSMAVVPQVLELLLAGIEQEIDRRGARERWAAAHRIAPHLPVGARRLLFRSVHRQLGGQLELFVSGGAALDPAVAAAWERMGVTVLEGYGATECAPSIASGTRAARRPGSVGRPVPGVEVRIGAGNEVQVRGANVTPGYWQDEEATRAAFTDDGWYRTGDLGELDRDGFLFLRGRLKDLIVLASGLNVLPEDVEAELAREQAVAECAVVGARDARGAPHVHAVVVPSPDGMPPGTGEHERVAQAVRSANRRLAPHQRIADFTVWEGELPRTSVLKVRRHELLASLGEGRHAASTAPLPGPGVDRTTRLYAMLADLAPAGTTIGPSSDLVLDLGLDSLARVELAVRLEHELGLSLEDGDLARVVTVGDLARLVEEGPTVPPTQPFPDWALEQPIRAMRSVLQWALLFPAHAVVCHPFTIEGRERLERVDGPVLLVPNHCSHLDTPSILRALPRRLRSRVAVAAAADYFFRTRALAVVMPLLLNAFPFSREGAVRSSLEHCGDLVDHGWSVLVYPEGTRSVTGRLQPFRSGTGLLAAELRVPVVPIGIAGTHALLPKGSRRPRRGPVTVRIGVPLQPDRPLSPAETTTLLHEAVALLVTYEGRAGAAAGATSSSPLEVHGGSHRRRGAQG
jgi:long-chain acyl-CoA synthetase